MPLLIPLGRRLIRHLATRTNRQKDSLDYLNTVQQSFQFMEMAVNCAVNPVTQTYVISLITAHPTSIPYAVEILLRTIFSRTMSTLNVNSLEACPAGRRATFARFPALCNLDI
jgi:hypothetical protein